ncbi:MAG: sel1 repeat family protein, partial [Rhodobacterales bacterium]|nr:sel1 repeat family protein [Rhodobacterales bacterium]
MMISLRVMMFSMLCTTLGFGAARADIAAGIAALEQGDAETAAQSFQTSFENGEADGAFYLGRMFELGLGTQPDLAQAAELYKAAAARESALAMNRLGLMYLDGQGVIRDFTVGAELICKAAEKGEAN